MPKKYQYLDTLFTDLSEQVGWDLISEKEVLMNFIANNDLSDEFMNYAESIAEEELSENHE